MLGPFQGTENRHAERTQKPRPGGIAQALEKARSRFVAVDSRIEARWEACPARRGPMQAGCHAAPSRRLAQAPARHRFSLPWLAGVVGAAACCAIAAITCATEAVRRLAYGRCRNSLGPCALLLGPSTPQTIIWALGRLWLSMFITGMVPP